MPQNCLLFKRTILENITYDNRNVSINEVMDVVRKYNLTKHFKNGLDISSGSLSGGQRQLVWLLRIYFKNPELIILDEPTASLDKETKDLLITLMNTMLKDKTIIIITHDQYMIDFVTRAEDIKLLSG
jgi:ABC-type bacteriocin/lantibiotic exporter with double-glycine peptidase domain